MRKDWRLKTVNGLLGSGGTSAYNEEFVQHTLKMLRVSCVYVVRSVILRFSSRFVPQSMLKELCDLSRGYSFIAEAYGAILDESGVLFIEERAGDETRIIPLGSDEGQCRSRALFLRIGERTQAK